MKKTLRLKFTGFAPYHDPRRQAYYRFLSERYNLVECEDPDYVIDGGEGFHHLWYDGIKILINSENFVPDFNHYDYAIGGTELTFADRYTRVPWFAFYPEFKQLADRPRRDDHLLLNRGFCSFVVSNLLFGDPMRKLFFDRLSRYKPVASGGKLLNNVGGPVADKLAFCRGYKFNIAFENSSMPGYTTEKIMEAYAAHTLPIYYGNPTVETDFLPSSMVRVSGPDDIERAVEEIIRLDQDDEAYLERVSAPCLTRPIDFWESRVNDFLAHVFDQPLETARRRARYGYQAMFAEHLDHILRLDQRLRDSKLFAAACSVAGRIRETARLRRRH